jgi:DNA primase small subunit
MATREPETKRLKTEDGEKENVALNTGNVGKARVKSLMYRYYKQFYPADLLFKWLAHGNDERHARAEKTYPSRREFCFVLDKEQEEGGGEIFARYQSFVDAKDFKTNVERKKPARIEFGPICNRRPSDRHTVELKPEERELVFDIDMTDYDDVRTCCKEAGICGKCWPLMTVALKVLDVGLREDFGFKHLLWVYSGRRGIHCWISDERARKLSDEARSAVAEYFAVVKGEGQGRRVLSSTPMHPSVKRAYDGVLKQYWIESYLPTQRILEDKTKLEQLLNLIPDENIREDLASEFATSSLNSVDRWGVIERRVQDSLKKNNYKLTGALEKIILWHIYPRVDIEVSRHMNHLLKGPFCVHPKTGRVCVPMDPATADSFNPELVPTVVDLDSGAQTLDGAIKTFNDTFWNACARENIERLTAKTRQAKAEQQSGMEF